MPSEGVLYVLAGFAGLRYVERRGRLFRTFRRIRRPAATPSLPVRGNSREANSFRNLLMLALRDARADGDIDKFDSLILVAPPTTLETLVSSLPGNIRRKVVAYIDRDLSRIRDQDLPRYLPLHLVYRSRSPDAALYQV